MPKKPKHMYRDKFRWVNGSSHFCQSYYLMCSPRFLWFWSYKLSNQCTCDCTGYGKK